MLATIVTQGADGLTGEKWKSTTMLAVSIVSNENCGVESTASVGSDGEHGKDVQDKK